MPAFYKARQSHALNEGFSVLPYNSGVSMHFRHCQNEINRLKNPFHPISANPSKAKILRPEPYDLIDNGILSSGSLHKLYKPIGSFLFFKKQGFSGSI